MTDRSGSFIKEEINKVSEDLKKLIEEEKKEYKELEELGKKAEKEVEKGLRSSGKSIEEEELEWDWNNTCLGIEDKKRKLAELREEGIVDKLIERAETKLKWAKEFLRDTEAKEKEQRLLLKKELDNSEKSSADNKGTTAKGNKHLNANKIESIEYDLQSQRKGKIFWTKEISELKYKLRRLNRDKQEASEPSVGSRDT